MMIRRFRLFKSVCTTLSYDDDWQVLRAGGEQEKVYNPSHENSNTKSTESLAPGQRKQRRNESHRKGSPWLIHKLSSEEFYWITTRHWQLCLCPALCSWESTAGGCFALYKKMHKSSLNQSQLHTESDAHPFVSCSRRCKGWVISVLCLLFGQGKSTFKITVRLHSLD